MTSTIEQLHAKKNSGIKNMQLNKFSEAITDFQFVIDSLTPQTDDEIILKGICYLNIGKSQLNLHEIDKAVQSIDAVAALYNEHRPSSQVETQSLEEIRADPLTKLITSAYVCYGLICEQREQYRDALQRYSMATSVYPDGEGQQLQQLLLERLGVPEFKTDDPDLIPFAAILTHVLTVPNLVHNLTDLIKHLLEDTYKPEVIKKFNETHVGQIFWAVLQLYSDQEPIVDMCLNAIRICGEKQIYDVFYGIMIISVAFRNFPDSIKINGDCLRILGMAPQEIIAKIQGDSIIAYIGNALKLDLQPSERDAAFMTLYHVVDDPQSYNMVIAEGIADVCYNDDSVSAMILMSKLTGYRALVEQLWAENYQDKVLAQCQQHGDQEQVAIVGPLLLASIFSYVEKEQLKGIAPRAFDILFPVVMAHKKEASVVAYGYAAMAQIVEFAAEQAIEKKAVLASSVVLSMYLGQATVAQNVVTFIYECAANGQVQQCKECHALQPTIMKIIKTFTTYGVIVERSIGILVLTEHPNRKELLKSAILQFPESTFFKQFLDVLEIPQLSSKS